MMKIAAVVAVLAIALPAQAHAFNEADFLRQSKFCESATRLSGGDVNPEGWFDCMEHQGKLRTKEQRDADYASPRTPWSGALSKSLFWASEDGCERWAAKERQRANSEHEKTSIERGYLAENVTDLEEHLRRFDKRLKEDPGLRQWLDESSRISQEVYTAAWNRCMERAGIFGPPR